MTLEFCKKDNKLILIYSPQHSDPNWISNKFSHNENIILSKTFYFTKTELIKTNNIENEFQKSIDSISNEYVTENNSNQDYIENDEYMFRIAELNADSYYEINSDILRLEYDLYIHNTVKLKPKFFIAEKSVSIFKEFNKLMPGSIYIGGNATTAIPEKLYYEFIESFPTRYELQLYVKSRIGTFLEEYADIKKDNKKAFEIYLNKKLNRFKRSNVENDNLLVIDKEKYKFILNRFEVMLSSDKRYIESKWQRELIQIIQWIYPKYIHVLSKVIIHDPIENKRREIDLLLIDFNGNVDVVEIKTPHNMPLLRNSEHRNNHVPSLQLIQTVMQAEKYINVLNHNGYNIERELNKKYANELPKSLKIQIINPKAILVIGRSNDFNVKQARDFELIKRKYENITDIMSYDDIKSRLEIKIQSINVS